MWVSTTINYTNSMTHEDYFSLRLLTSSELDIFLLRDVLTLAGTKPQENYQDD